MPFIELHGWNGSLSLLMFIGTIFFIWLILVVVSLRKFGTKKTIRYFFPMIIASLFLEAAAVVSGRYVYPGYFGYLSVIGGSVPLIILLGWSSNLFLFLNLGKYTVNGFFTQRPLLRITIISVIAGLFGVCLDVLEDPVAHYNNWWVWTQQTPTFSFYGVPFSNFLDWFIILFYMALATQLIDQSKYSENRKLLISIISVAYIGAAIFITHMIVVAIFPMIGK